MIFFSGFFSRIRQGRHRRASAAFTQRSREGLSSRVPSPVKKSGTKLALFLTLGGALARADAPPPFEPTQWLLVEYTVAETKIPILKDVRAETTMTFLYDLEEKNGRVQGEGKVCDLRIESHSKIVQMHFSKRFIRSLTAPAIDAPGRGHALPA